MTRIVDADELRELYIERNNFDTYNDYSFAIDTLDYMPTVEAIPIEWLEEKLTGHPELPYAITDGISNVLDLWKAKQEDKK